MVFRGRHFQDEVIVLCVGRYLRYSLSYRDLEELMAERGLCVDHSTIARWVVRYAPILNQRMQRHRVAGKWTYLYRAVDSTGDTIDFLLSCKRDADAAKRFFQKALRSSNHARPRVINVDGNPSYPKVIDELKRTRELGRRCRCRPFAISTMWWNRIIGQSNAG